MAQWQILTPQGKPTGETFDDGAPEQPGDTGFTSAAVVAHVQALGGGQTFNYVGVSPGVVVAS